MRSDCVRRCGCWGGCRYQEARRLQLESAVLRICAHGTEGGEFLAGDLLGALYGVNQYQVLWKVR